jgi:arginyl-tRNA synthetase
MKRNIQDLLIVLIEDSLRALGVDRDFNEDLYLDFPTDGRFGDLSTNIALRLSKQLKKSPAEIANKIVETINQN